jgi:hypothetical protein
MAKFVKITSTDENGSFEHVGQLIRENKEGALIRMGIGEMFFPKGDFTMTNARTPRNFNATIEAAAEVVTKEVKAKAEKPAKAAKAPKVAKEKKVTKLDAAVAALVAFKSGKADASRQEMIHHLMSAMDIADKKRASGLYQAAIKRV